MATFIGNERRTSDITFWSLGSLKDLEWTEVYITFPIILLGAVILPLMGRQLNIMTLGETEARNLGVNTDRVRRLSVVLFSVGYWGSGWFCRNYRIHRLGGAACYAFIVWSRPSTDLTRQHFGWGDCVDSGRYVWTDIATTSRYGRVVRGTGWCVNGADWWAIFPRLDFANAASKGTILMLVAHQLGFRIGQRWLVNDVSLDLKAGEFVVIVGANGAGKTSLLRLLCGEWQPTSGHVELNKQPLSAYSLHDLSKKRSVMRQQSNIGFDFTVEEVVLMGRYPHRGHSTAVQDRQIAEAVLKRTETTHLRERLYATLSDGEKARVTLGRILAQQTPLVLMDEPTSAMDLRHQQLSMEIARELVDEGNTVLAILHDLNLASLYADRVGMIKHGQLHAIGTPEEVFTTENIKQVFNIPVHIIPHPDRAVPLVVPLHR